MKFMMLNLFTTLFQIVTGANAQAPAVGDMYTWLADKYGHYYNRRISEIRNLAIVSELVGFSENSSLRPFGYVSRF